MAASASSENRLVGNRRAMVGSTRPAFSVAGVIEEVPMKVAILRCSVFAMLVLASPAPATADVVSDWNERAVSLLVSQKLGPPAAERVLAMMHLAMFDATNAIEPRYTPYAAKMTVAGAASKEAAASVAAAAVLLASSAEDRAPEI